MFIIGLINASDKRVPVLETLKERFQNLELKIQHRNSNEVIEGKIGGKVEKGKQKCRHHNRTANSKLVSAKKYTSKKIVNCT